MNTSKKKLLILGGHAHSIGIVNKAQEMGLYTCVLDWNKPEQSPAKLIADEYSMLSIADTDAIVNYLQEQKFDGVITGYTDSYLPFYAEICKKACLPCYADAEHFALTLDKKKFKEACKQHGLQTIPEFHYSQNARIELKDKLPLLFKPVDNSGSRGIVKCANAELIEDSYQRALAASRKGEVLIEKLMQCDDVSVAYTLRNGEAHLSVVCDRYFNQLENGGSVTTGLIYPSKYTDLYIEEIDEKLKKMFHLLGYRNGVLFLQMFVDNGTFYIYEMGYRLSGGNHFIFTKHQNGVSALEMLIRYAITGDMGAEINQETPHFPQICSQLSVLCKKDTIEHIRGAEAVKQMPEVIEFTLLYKEGEQTGDEGTTAQITAKIHVVVNDMESLQKVANDIRKTLSIVNAAGENMILDFFTSGL